MGQIVNYYLNLNPYSPIVPSSSNEADPKKASEIRSQWRIMKETNVVLVKAPSSSTESPGSRLSTSHSLTTNPIRSRFNRFLIGLSIGLGRFPCSVYGPLSPHTITIQDGFGQFLQEDEEEMFEFQGLLDDKEIQEILDCSFSDEPDQLISQGSFMINGDHWSSTDLATFGI
ncbi:hypothetical protein F2Q69_00027253 [Brassica cretica]|uniref:Uncharacterized protein n=1 Tax=Brassica cretica TaxID=69181 RepID=A0A8S9RU97_BRACR|nr:hypothetical protein F2Q69_00027253 [Brassica cretica]